MDLADRLRGTLLGTAVGDAYGLPYENLTPARADAWMGDESGPLRFRLLPGGGGLISDDTEHAALALQSMARHPRDADAFARDLARSLRWWMAALPPGVGGATLKACVRLWAGLPPDRSGVRSGGNGPAMRAPVIGVFHRGDPALRAAFVRASTRITHTDARAEIAAQAVARLASLASFSPRGGKPSWAAVEREMAAAAGDVPGADAAALADWSEALDALRAAVSAPCTASLPWGKRGPSGYALHSVPAAVLAWWTCRGPAEDAIRAAVRLGGDADSVAAVVGALCGALGGEGCLSADAVEGIVDWPRGPGLLRRIAARAALAAERGTPVDAVSYPLWPLLPRNLALFAVVFGHVLARPFRRRGRGPRRAS